MDPLRRQHHDLSLFATTVFAGITWGTVPPLGRGTLSTDNIKNSLTSHQKLGTDRTRPYRVACTTSAEHTHRNGRNNRIVSITGSGLHTQVSRKVGTQINFKIYKEAQAVRSQTRHGNKWVPQSSEPHRVYSILQRRTPSIYNSNVVIKENQQITFITANSAKEIYELS